MSVQHDEITQWIIKGDHDLGTAKVILFSFLYHLSLHMI
jgi:hypothetical protein